MQTEHHPHSSTRQYFHPPSLDDDPPPWPAWPSATADSTSTIISTHCRHHHFDSPAPPSQSCAGPPPHRAHCRAQSRLAGLAWPGCVAAQQQHAPGAQQLRSQQSRAHAVEHRRRQRASPLSREASGDPPPAARASGDPPWTRTLFSDAPNSLFVHFARRPVVTRAK
ncbi:putative GPI-anchored protein 58 [Iris pallida]|uniref:GPI-anchored protein 58 n=1 Tax=Iris pallida TaxID=29817 RepID=A0AAX6IDA8_IRIPA|nr:putative GPI-anchored protein 58 [Iris pallida]